MEEDRKKLIVGSGKGGAGTAYEADDNLLARHQAAVLDIVSEGEIVGLVNGVSSIFFNETRLKNIGTGKSNFEGADYIIRYGTQDQSVPEEWLANFSSASYTQDFSSQGKLETDTPQYAKITTGGIERSEVDLVKLTIFTDAMYKVNKETGDTTYALVNFDIDFTYSTSTDTQTTINLFRTAFNGKCGSKYSKTFIADISQFQPFEDWELKVTRVDEETSNSAGNPTVSTTKYKVFNNIYIGVLEAQIVDKLEYPHSAYIGVKLDAEAFGTRIPNRAYDLKGLKISVPTNYLPSDDNAQLITLSDESGFAANDSVTQKFTVSTLTASDADDYFEATGTTSVDHGYENDQELEFTITGATVGSGEVNPYNGSHTVKITDTDKFTYAMSSNPATNSAGGTIIATVATGKVHSISGSIITVRDITGSFSVGGTIDDGDSNSTTISLMTSAIISAAYTRDPSNGNITTSIQDWDGNFWTSWTDNPAWIYYDLLTNKRYGLGNYIDSADVDKWELFNIAKYCDELVLDPTDVSGTTYEPRFSCNLYLTKATEAFKVLQDMASAFRGMQYYMNGMIVPIQDREKDPVYQFTDANVVNGMFEYEGSSQKTRHNMVKVTYNDPNNFYKQTVEYVQDEELLAKTATDGGFPKLRTIAAFGCTSRGQASRLGKWLLATEKLSTETIKFKTGMNASFLRPGDVINVIDSRRQGVSYGGRVLKPTTTSQLVTNGTFGSGITSWTQGTATQSHDTSNKRIKLTSGGTEQTPRSYQSLGTLTANKTYRVKARAFCGQTMDTDSGNEQYATVSVTTATNATGDLTATGTYRTQSTTATFIDFTVTVGGSNATHYLQLEGVKLDNTENVSFDSIEVYQVNTINSVRIDRGVDIVSGQTYSLTLTKPGYIAKLAQDSATISINSTNTALVRGDIITHKLTTLITTQTLSQQIEDTSGNQVFVDWSPHLYAEKNTINNSVATDVTVLTTNGAANAFSAVPDDETIWILQKETVANELKAQQYTVIQVSEAGNTEYDINALKYVASKFDFVDKHEPLDTFPTILAPKGTDIVPSPLSPVISYHGIAGAGNTITPVVTIAWSPPKIDPSTNAYSTTTANNTIIYPHILGYNVKFTTTEEDVLDIFLGGTTSTSIDLVDPRQTTYTFKISTINTIGIESAPVEKSYTVTAYLGAEMSSSLISGVNTGGTLHTSISISSSNVSFGSSSPKVSNILGKIKSGSVSTPLAFAGLANSGVGYVYWDYSAGTITAKVRNILNDTWYTLAGSEWSTVSGITAACTAGSENHKITGSTTSFTGNFAVGSKIRLDDEDDETYTIIEIESTTVLYVSEPITTTQTTATIRKESFIPDRVEDVILATITENSSGNAWVMEQHCQTPGIQGAQGATGEGGYSVKLEPSKHVISYTVEGDEADTITFTTTPTGIAGTATYTFQVDGSTASGTTAGQSSGSFTLADGEEPADSDSIIVKVILYDNGVSKASDTVSIYGIKSGTDAITVILTNDSHTIPTDNDGSSGNYTKSGTDIRVWRGGTALAYHASSANTFSVGTPIDTDITVGDASTYQTYTRRYDVASAFTTGTSTKTASISFPVTVRDAAGGGTQTFDKIQTFSKSFKGEDAPFGYITYIGGDTIIRNSAGTYSATYIDVDVTFSQASADVARDRFRINRSSDTWSGSLTAGTHAGGDLNTGRLGTAVAVSSKTAVLKVTYTLSGVTAEAAANVKISHDAQEITTISLYKLNDSTITTNNFGTFADPDSGAESGWSETIPDLGTTDGNTIYVTRRKFTSDGASPQESTWSAPVIHSKYTKGADGSSGYRGYSIFTIEESSQNSPNVSAANVLSWVGDTTFDDTNANAIAAAVIDLADDSYLRPNDRITVTDNSASKAGTRIYTAAVTNTASEADAADFSSLVVESFAGSVIVDGTLAAGKLTSDFVYTKAMTVGSGNNVFRVNTSGDIWSGNATEGSAPFQVTNAGVLTLSGASSSISVGSGDSIFKATSSGIQLGHATFGSAPFRVTPAGALTATGATISGSITMTNIGSIDLGDFNNDEGFTDDTTASAASTAATNAANAATAAQGTANSATSTLADIADDDKLTPSEKQQAKTLWDAVATEYAGIITSASNAGSSSTAYATAYTNLNTYLNTSPDVFDDMSATTDISRTTWNARWVAYYDAKQALLDAIAAALKVIADAAIVNAATAQTAIDLMETRVVLDNTGMELQNVDGDKVAKYGTTSYFYDGSSSENIKLKVQAAGITAYGDDLSTYSQMTSAGLTIFNDGAVADPNTGVAHFGTTMRIGPHSTTQSALRVLANGTLTIGTSNVTNISLTNAGVATIAGTFTLGASSTLDGETIMANDSEKTDGQVGGWTISANAITSAGIVLNNAEHYILISDDT